MGVLVEGAHSEASLIRQYNNYSIGGIGYCGLHEMGLHILTREGLNKLSHIPD
jgi:hypothetical protein